MVREPDAILEAQKSIALKLDEPEPYTKNPWGDDLLARQEIATRLTNLVATQVPPLTVSLHGQWGTGKTFMLRRWQKELESQDPAYKAIYFNAWEDDFCDDPLLAFVGQLSDYFGKAGQGSLLDQAVQKALPLLRENLTGILRATTGISIDLHQLAQSDKSLLDIYQEQRATKDELRKELAVLAEKVASQTSHPLVFIVDELDRCRPTFAIELLERVKHVFDVPNIVFVFGLNRDELCEALTSVYGDIDADVYLRRFFDFEFNLPEGGAQRFGEHLIDKFQLGQAFQTLSKASENQNHIYDYENFREVCPKLWNALGLSLRDIDYAVRLIALLTRNLEVGNFAHPYLAALLIGFKFKRRQFYDSMVSGSFLTRQIVLFLSNESVLDPADTDLNRHFDRIEGFLYCAESTPHGGTAVGTQALREVERLLQGGQGFQSEVLSNRSQNGDQEMLNRIRQSISDGLGLGISQETFGQLAEWIDTYQSVLRR